MTNRRRALIIFNCVLATVLIGSLAAFGYVKWKRDQFESLDVAGLEQSSGPMNMLLVGSDSREGVDEEQFGTTEDVAEQRSDTIMILRVDPSKERAAIMSLPRDLWVDLYSADGTNQGKGRINAAFMGGPDQLIETIDQNFGIGINHYMQVDFNGFRDIVAAVDGVTVRFDSPVRDTYSGLNIPEAGCQVLDGEQSLAYVRSRHYETYEGGRWVEDPRADLSRIDRQQDFIRRVLRSAIDKGARNPITLNSLINAGAKNIQLDSEFGATDIIRTGLRFRSLDPGDVEMMTLPNSTASVYAGGAMQSVLQVDQPAADETIDRFINGPPEQPSGETVPVGSVSVRVLNGSGAPGQASIAAGGLRSAGFVVTGAGDASVFGTATTTIRYASGMEAEANTVAQHVGGEVRLLEDATLSGADVALVTGSTFTGIVAPGEEAPESTTTSGAPAEPSAVPEEEEC